jgi:oxygen-independent coproporphyrinogen-3 oxidase
LKSTRSLSLYLHTPFCRHKCGYCDFNSWGEENLEPQKRWLAAIQEETLLWSQRLGTNYEILTCFVGGGTPSLLAPEIWEELSLFLKKELAWAPNFEWTLEANPEDVTASKLAFFRDIGINRISMGVQSFEEKYLARLERKASPQRNREALAVLAEHWPARWSLDLMYALPGQTLAEWERDLRTALEFQPRHISTYQLTLSTERSRNWEQAPEDELHSFYELKKEILEDLGFLHYEISNFAKAGEECRHNLAYWELQSFLGLGPGAYGLVDGLLLPDSASRFGAHTRNAAHFEKWLDSTKSLRHSSRFFEERSPKMHFQELLMMGLRLQKGLSYGKLPSQFRDFLKDNPSYKGLLDCSPEGGLKATEKARQILDFLLKKLFRDMESLGSRLDFEHCDPIFGRCE